jgi:hypothetical protein
MVALGIFSCMNTYANFAGRLSLFLVSGLFLAACSSGPKIVANQDPAADFTQYRTYAYMQPLSTDRNGAKSVLSSFLMNATSGQLDSRGLRQVDGNPDLLVDFVVATQEKIQSRSQPTTSVSMHRGRGGAGTWGGYSAGMSTTSVTQTTEGTLAIDLIDTKRNQLIWEAAATGRVTDKVRENLEEVSNAAVADMFERFPLPSGAIPAP